MHQITLKDALEICKANAAFSHSVFITENGTKVHNFNYGLAGYKDFANPIEESDIEAYELRGISFVEYETHVERFLLLRKFFGYNSTLGHSYKDLKETPIYKIGEKLDGSLARFIIVDKHVRARTSNHILYQETDRLEDGRLRNKTPHATLIQNLYERDKNLKGFIDETLNAGLAAIFEYQDPEWDIVINASEISLKLIQMRDEKTGVLLDIENHPLVLKYQIPTTPQIKDIKTLDDLIKLQETENNTEGWVVHFKDDKHEKLVKFKTKWYDDLHDIVFEGRLNAKTLLTSLLNKTLDDVSARFDENHPYKKPIILMFDSVAPHIEKEKQKIRNFVQNNKDLKDNTQKRKSLAGSMPNSEKFLLGFAVQYADRPEALEEELNRMFKIHRGSEDKAEKFLNQINPEIVKEINHSKKEFKRIQDQKKEEFRNLIKATPS